MIVKIVNEANKFETKFVDCVSATIRPDNPEDLSENATFGIDFMLCNREDMIWPLSENDRVYYLNNNGQTIDRDFRMVKKVTSPIGG